jgi:hypothetical protein
VFCLFFHPLFNICSFTLYPYRHCICAVIASRRVVLASLVFNI